MILIKDKYMEKFFEFLTSTETMEIFGGEETTDEKVYEFILIDGELIRITRK